MTISKKDGVIQLCLREWELDAIYSVIGGSTLTKDMCSVIEGYKATYGDA